MNEADIEWPPSPWRILRSLVAIWHRKADAERFPQPSLDGLIEKLADQLPDYRIPPAVRAHSRHYMPQGRIEKGREGTSLVFDAFARIARGGGLIVAWPSLNLSSSETDLLKSLVRGMGFLGRAESWVEGRVVDDWDGSVNCRASTVSIDADTGELFEAIRLAAPLPPAEYAAWREEVVAAHGLDSKRLNAKERRLHATLPERLVDAIRLGSSDIQRVGWSCPPGARFVTYQRPYDVFAPPPSVGTSRPLPPVTTARLALAGKPLPRIEDAVRIGELVRLAAVRSAETFGEGVPPALSGHDLSSANQHGHAFYLPEASSDGRIGHVTIYAADGLDGVALRALDRINRIGEEDGAEWRVLFEHYGQPSDFPRSPYCARSTVWQSVTPYLHPWFWKKNFTIEDQIRRECRLRGHPEPDLDQLATISVKGRQRRPVHFHRFRRKRGLAQPDTRGTFWRLRFPGPIDGPLALGFGCHFGLGCFRAVREHSRPLADPCERT